MARGPLRIQQFQALANLGTSVGGTSGMVAAEAEALSATANRLGRTADRAAAREGEIAGTQAALEGKPALRNSGSIYGESFDRAAISTYADQLDTRLYTEADALARKHEADPAGLQTSLAALRETMLANDVIGDPRLQAAFTRSFDRVSLGHVRAAERAAKTRAEQAQAAAATEAVNASRRNLEQQAYALGTDPEGLAATEEEAAKVSGIVKRAEASGAIAPGSADDLIKGVAANRIEAHLKGEFDRLPAGERKGFIDRLTEDFKTGKGLAGKLDLDGFQKLTNGWDVTLRRADAETSRAETEMKQRIELIRKDTSEGYMPSSQQWTALESAAAAVPGGLDTVKALRAEGEFFRRLGVSSVVEAEAAVGDLQAGAAEGRVTGATAKAGEKYLGEMRKELKDNPLGWAGRTGLFDIAPIDPAQPETLAGRAAVAEAVASHYGVPPVYLTPAERVAFQQAAAKGGEVMMANVTALARGFGDRAPRVLAEVAQDAPLTAHVGGILLNGGSQQLAADVADTIAMRNDPNVKARPKTDAQTAAEMTAANAVAAQVYGDAFRMAGKARDGALSTALLAFEGRAVRRGLVAKADAPDSRAVFERTLQEAAGATFDREGTQFGGVTERRVGGFLGVGGRTDRVLVPSNIRADRFGDVIGALEDGDFTLPNLTAEKVRAARLVAVAPGQYRVALGDPDSDDPRWIRDASGLDFILDLQALEPALRRRVPGAFR
ncbi:hypothetical protein [Ancylobacter sp. SL191]|uniref:hypothetical protein n=1 Tax=Ancylobacter sp. SL191 TaxID=2995166 RepID=UPI00226F4C81|nr:hypothetical protein [Ancylobacter sp. SL191]WAC26343.1 hypothetical protein OU996_15155 [Ancylobacter sp. SL191]